MAVINRSHEWEVEFDGEGLQKLEDAKTLKAVMFLMIQEIVKTTPNDQELGARIRKILLNFNKENENN